MSHHSKRPVTPMERALVYPVVGTVIGAWAGVFPLALDWDEPWQVIKAPLFSLLHSISSTK